MSTEPTTDKVERLRTMSERMEAEEFEARVRHAAGPELAERWLGIAEAEVREAYEHGTTTTLPNAEWVRQARRRVYEAIAAGVSPEDYRPVRIVSPPGRPQVP